MTWRPNPCCGQKQSFKLKWIILISYRSRPRTLLQTPRPSSFCLSVCLWLNCLSVSLSSSTAPFLNPSCLTFVGGARRCWGHMEGVSQQPDGASLRPLCQKEGMDLEDKYNMNNMKCRLRFSSSISPAELHSDIKTFCAAWLLIYLVTVLSPSIITVIVVHCSWL